MRLLYYLLLDWPIILAQATGQGIGATCRHGACRHDVPALLLRLAIWRARRFVMDKFLMRAGLAVGFRMPIAGLGCTHGHACPMPRRSMTHDGIV